MAAEDKMRLERIMKAVSNESGTFSSVLMSVHNINKVIAVSINKIQSTLSTIVVGSDYLQPFISSFKDNYIGACEAFQKRINDFENNNIALLQDFAYTYDTKCQVLIQRLTSISKEVNKEKDLVDFYKNKYSSALLKREKQLSDKQKNYVDTEIILAEGEYQSRVIECNKLIKAKRENFNNIYSSLMNLDCDRSKNTFNTLYQYITLLLQQFSDMLAVSEVYR